jgi:pimeloyl-ACP methyl ester carboxylesterase
MRAAGLLALVLISAASIGQTDVTDATDIMFDIVTDTDKDRQHKCTLTIKPPPDRVLCASGPDYRSASADPGRATVRGTCPPLSGYGRRSDGLPISRPFPLGVTTILWHARDGHGNTAQAVQKITVVRAALATDSNNDGTIDDADRAIEDDPNKPGNIVIATKLDRLGTGIPGFASGLDRFPNNPPYVPCAFRSVLVTVSPEVDVRRARLRIRYSAADPALVRRSAGSGGRLAVYDPGSANPIRIWVQDNNASRRVAPLTASPSGDYVPPNSAIPASKVFGQARTARWFVEGINESRPGDVRIALELDPDGSGRFCPMNAVRFTVAEIRITYTDASGLTYNNRGLTVNRIPSDVEPDGIACDWLENVGDGALLLMRVHVSKVLYDLWTQPGSGRTLSFGYVHPATGSFAPLPTNGFEGEYRGIDEGFVPSARGILANMGVPLPGDQDPNTKLYVLDARFYRPPYEFDMASPLNPAKERKLRLGVRLQHRGGLVVEGTKPNAIYLTRPPLVLVHGINSSAAMWYQAGNPKSFGWVFDRGPNNYGFRCINFRVDHSGVDPARPNEGKTYGMGPVPDMYRFVAKKISEACDGYRSGDYGAGIGPAPPIGKRYAVQKVDVVCHSYGGILTRWYVEQAGVSPGIEFENVRNVRKLITLGTPHKGSPLANMVCEVYRSTLIANAEAGAFGPGTRWLSMKGFLDLLESQKLLPNALPPTRTAPRHAYQEFCVNSERLATLNAKPFHPDVAYAAIIGTNIQLKNLRNPYIAFAPFWSPATRSTYGYFPWIYHFNSGPGATDSIVPRWSAELGVASHNVYLPVTHEGMDEDQAVQQTVRAWLNGADPATGALRPMPLGSAQRAAYRNTPPVSDRNAYDGSRVGPDNISRGGGLRRRAIVKVELSDTDPFTATFGTGPDEVGPKPVVLTGMIQLKDVGTKRFVIESHERGWNNTLHDLGIVPRADYNLDPADLQGADDDDWVTYRITTGRIGRKKARTLTGPSGTSTYVPGGNHLVSYAMDSIPDGHSPPTAVTLPTYVLPPPSKGGTGNLTITVTGAVECENSATGSQTVTVELYSKRYLSDDKLEVMGFSVAHPPRSWDGLLIPYRVTTTLSFNAKGYLSGNNSWTRSNPADIYQMLIMSSVNPFYRPESATIKVP